MFFNILALLIITIILLIFKQKELLNSLNIVTKATKRNILQAILECVLIDATKNEIIFTCTDGKEITIRKIVDGIILEKERTAKDGALFTNIVRTLPENNDIEFYVNDNLECNINCIGRDLRQKIQAKDEYVYPNIMNINKENKVTINEYNFKKNY